MNIKPSTAVDVDDDDEVDIEQQEYEDSAEEHARLAAPIGDRIAHWVRMHLAPQTCPYAREAWATSNVRLYVRDTLEDLTVNKATDPVTAHEVGIYVWTAPDSMSYDDFLAWLKAQNQNHFGIWLTAIHPSDPNLARIPGHEELAGVCLIKMLTLPTVAKAAAQLAPGGFYVNARTEQRRAVVERGAIAEAWQRALASGFDPNDDDAIQAFYDERAN